MSHNLIRSMSIESNVTFYSSFLIRVSSARLFFSLSTIQHDVSTWIGSTPPPIQNPRRGASDVVFPSSIPGGLHVDANERSSTNSGRTHLRLFSNKRKKDDLLIQIYFFNALARRRRRRKKLDISSRQ
jgi:hypothetical protein